MSKPPLPSEITPERTWLNRRQVLAGLAGGGLALGASWSASGASQPTGKRLTFGAAPRYSTPEQANSWEEVTTYNNFYEFGTDKADPARRAASLRVSPWEVRIGGEAEVTGRFALEDLLKGQTLEERIYRLRCVEAWSMVIPWVGFPLAGLIQRFKPTSRARYVRFTTLADPAQMPGLRSPVLNWPYIEGLRMDEAMHPLTLMAVGLYGRVLPNQNGAPFRLVVPWKYGFKSIKSIVAIDFTERRPKTSWELAAPREYGFFANVNPEVDHPRWSQARERRIGAGSFWSRQATLPFNGYATEVAGMYRGMDLKRYF